MTDPTDKPETLAESIALAERNQLRAENAELLKALKFSRVAPGANRNTPRHCAPRDPQDHHQRQSRGSAMSCMAAVRRGVTSRIWSWGQNRRIKPFSDLIYNLRDLMRIVMYRECDEFIEGMDPPTLDVLEISAGSHFKEFPFSSYRETSFPEFDVCEDVLEEGSFDLVIADQVFEHLKWPYRAGRNVLRMLRPGGWFVVTTPFFIKLHSCPDLDCTRWTEDGMRYLLAECGFDEASIKTGSWGNRSYIRSHLAGRWPRRGFQGALTTTRCSPSRCGRSRRPRAGHDALPLRPRRNRVPLSLLPPLPPPRRVSKHGHRRLRQPAHADAGVQASHPDLVGPADDQHWPSLVRYWCTVPMLSGAPRGGRWRARAVWTGNPSRRPRRARPGGILDRLRAYPRDHRGSPFSHQRSRQTACSSRSRRASFRTVIASLLRRCSWISAMICL